MNHSLTHPAIRLGQYQGTVSMIKARYDRVQKWNDPMLQGLIQSLFNLHDEIEREFYRHYQPEK